VRYRHRVSSTKKLFAALTRPGPHHVLRGDLAVASLPGVVYTPESGLNLPAIAFGHDWLTGVGHYCRLLEHLASWGIVVAAPNTERGPAPSVLELASDLGTALDIAAGVRLGPGRISVHPTKLGLVGHGFGGSAAVFAAAGMPAKPAAAAAVFPTVTKPPPQEPAATLDVAGIVLATPDDATTWHSNTMELYRAWDGAVLRTVAKANAAGLAEGRSLMKAFGLPSSDRKTQKSVRALLTGYLLYALAGDKAYHDFADPDAKLPRTQPRDEAATPAGPGEKIAALLK
jgi:dienelactone hydrolase